MKKMNFSQQTVSTYNIFN